MFQGIHDLPLPPSAERIWRALPREWRYPEVTWQDPTWLSRAAIEMIVGDEEPMTWKLVDLDDGKWLLLYIEGTARLFRYTGEGYECRFLGSLEGAEYSESYVWRNENAYLHLKFEHERLNLELEFDAYRKLLVSDQRLREGLRRWAGGWAASNAAP